MIMLTWMDYRALSFGLVNCILRKIMAFFGVCYSPYHRTNTFPPGGVTEPGVDADMQIISRKFTHIRTYGVDGGNQWNVDKATKYKLTLALGVWVTPNNLPATQAQIDQALSQAQSAGNKYGTRLTLDLVIGNEVNRQDVGVYKPDLIRTAMQYAKAKVPGYPAVSARVTTCFSGTVLQNPNSEWLPVVDECNTVAYLTVYPWYGGAAPGNIDPQMQWSWNNGLKQVRERGKQVVIAEIGWPSAGGRDTSVANEQTNYAVTRKWVSGTNSLGMAFDTFWFEMFDEPWKTQEGPQGPHWGLCTSGSNPQPKFPF
jgi:exo-beta-1,3-glucanase (GH17 family)